MLVLLTRSPSASTRCPRGGVLTHTSGAHRSDARAEQTGGDKPLFTVDRLRVALLMRDPVAALEAPDLAGLVDEAGRHSPTLEGENRARAERLARRLCEAPALLQSDVDGLERAYFLGQRTRIEAAVEETISHPVDRCADGSALIVGDRAFTDVAFPTDATVKSSRRPAAVRHARRPRPT